MSVTVCSSDWSQSIGTGKKSTVETNMALRKKNDKGCKGKDHLNVSTKQTMNMALAKSE